MMKQAISQTQKILSLYEFKLAKAKHQCSKEKQRLSETEKKCDENTKSINALQAKLQQMQQQLIKTGQLTQWQACQAYSKSQYEMTGELVSQKSKLEFQLAVARQRVDKSIKALRKLRHKYEIIQTLQAHRQRQTCINTNERVDESSTQQWQQSQYCVEC